MRSPVKITKRQIVHVKYPHVKSLASLIKLSRYYSGLSSNVVSWRRWLEFRKDWLEEQDRNGLLYCWYCGRDDLIDTDKCLNNQLTIDHIIPVCKGGDILCKDNLAVCCHDCNKKKKDLNLLDFLFIRSV